MVKSFEFTWEEVTHVTRFIPVEDVVGCYIWHQPSDAEGEIVLKDGEPYIRWDRGVTRIALDSKEGREVISECKVWRNHQAYLDDVTYHQTIYNT